MKYGVCRKIDGTGDILKSKPGSGRQRSHVLSHMWNLDLKYILMCTYIYIQKYDCKLRDCVLEGREEGGRWKENDVIGETCQNTLCLCMKVAQSNSLKNRERDGIENRESNRGV
jgi:hypothetical protein